MSNIIFKCVNINIKKTYKANKICGKSIFTERFIDLRLLQYSYKVISSLICYSKIKEFCLAIFYRNKIDSIPQVSFTLYCSIDTEIPYLINIERVKKTVKSIFTADEKKYIYYIIFLKVYFYNLFWIFFLLALTNLKRKENTVFCPLPNLPSPEQSHTKT